MLKRYKNLKNKKGAAIVEYGILIGLIAVLAITAISDLGEQIQGVFTAVNSALTDANLPS